MKLIFDYIGRIIYVLSYPVIYFSVNGSQRTRVLIVCNNKLLLVRDWIGPARWSLPGGGMHKDENPKLGAIREAREEVGINLNKRQLKYLDKINYVKKKASSIRYFYSINIDSIPTLKLQKYEILQADWFSLEDLDNIKLSDDVKLILKDHKSLLK